MRQMEFDEFKDELRNYLENEHPEMNWDVATVHKVNKGEVTSLTGMMEGQTMAPCLYIEPFYEQYLQENMTFSAIATMIDYKYQDLQQIGVNFDAEHFMDFDRMKDSIIAQLINKDTNVEMLKDIPHTDVAGDMAVIYREVVSIDQDGMSSIVINNDMLKKWNQSVEQIHEIALENTPRLCPIKIQRLTDVILDIMKSQNASENEIELFREACCSMEDPLQMTVVTTQNAVNGATAIMYPEFKDWLKSFGRDAVILPSSVSEVICIKAGEEPDINELRELVKEVNQNVVSQQEYLSDNVYQVKEGKLMAIEQGNTNDMDSIIEKMLNDMEPPEPDFGLEM